MYHFVPRVAQMHGLEISIAIIVAITPHVILMGEIAISPLLVNRIGPQHDMDISLLILISLHHPPVAIAPMDAPTTGSETRCVIARARILNVALMVVTVVWR